MAVVGTVRMFIDPSANIFMYSIKKHMPCRYDDDSIYITNVSFVRLNYKT